MLAGEAAALELAYHEDLYSGPAQAHFAKAAVRLFRRHLVERILRRLGLGPSSQVLSLGCGIGDAEILLAGRVGHVTGIDISPKGIAQARADAAAAGVANTSFEVMDLETAHFGSKRFDAAVGVFFLHHLPDEELAAFPRRLQAWLGPRGCFYGLDPNRRRLVGALGKVLAPRLMARYRSPEERELLASELATAFRLSGFDVETTIYDFMSTALAGLCPAWGVGYRLAHTLDEVLVRTPVLRAIGGNLEVVARFGR